MALVKKFTGAALGVAVTVGLVALAIWITPPSWRTGSAQDSARPNRQPLISRGYTEAPAGTVVIAGDPIGGARILELRIKDGQAVKRDEIIAVLSGYPKMDVAVRTAEANLEKIKQLRQAMLTGTRVSEIAMQETAIKTTIEQNNLRALERQRSGKPPDQKALEISLDQKTLETQRATLHLQKQSLAADLALNQIDVANAQAALDNARNNREGSLVRSPVDGIVVQIFARQGERVSGLGIAKVVDMRQLRVVAEVDELHLGRLVPGARVEVTFRGNPTVYRGKVVRSPLTVTRLKRSKADLGEGSSHVVEAEIEFDDPSSIPPMLDLEARVTFL
jgi:multidrug efflux pump subunit AcrA (membrane-fusion protein)